MITQGEGPMRWLKGWAMARLGSPLEGFRLIRTEIEFWQDGEFRLHDRVRFTRADSIAPWTRQRLYP